MRWLMPVSYTHLKDEFITYMNHVALHIVKMFMKQSSHYVSRSEDEKARPTQEAGILVHNKIHSVEKDNSGVEGAHKRDVYKRQAPAG